MAKNISISQQELQSALSGLTPLKNLPEVNEFNSVIQEKLGRLVNVLIAELQKDPNLSTVVKHSLLRHFFWQATAYDNAGVGREKKKQHYWSKNAINQFYLNGGDKDLRHEHTIPIALLIKKVLNDNSDSIELMRRYSKAVILTKTEDASLGKLYKSTLPNGFDWDRPDFLLRYRSAGMSDIYDVSKSSVLKKMLW
jgi:hypothetical protein